MLTVRGHRRGWEIEWVPGYWVYADTQVPVDAEPDRPCARCRQPPTPEGHDACLGTIPGAVSACCGHGVEGPFILYEWEDAMGQIEITNPGFEGAWREVDGVGELKVAEGWTPWWHQTDRRPEFKIARPEVDPHRVHSGQQAQQWFTTHATHTGGIYQQVRGVPVGGLLTFSGWVQAFSRNDDGDWRKSDGRYRMRIGIDPYGGLDPESRDVVWSTVVQPYDSWTPLSVEADARSDRCTLYVWGQAEWPVRHNNGYVDDCELTVDGDAVPLPEPGEPGEYVTAEQARQIAREVVDHVLDQVMDGLAYLTGKLAGE